MFLELPDRDGHWKYVCVNGEYRFIDANHTWGPSHFVKADETAESAGMIYICETYWQMTDRWSMTLKVGSNEHDEENITTILGKPYKEMYL